MPFDATSVIWPALPLVKRRREGFPLTSKKPMLGMMGCAGAKDMWDENYSKEDYWMSLGGSVSWIQPPQKFKDCRYVCVCGERKGEREHIFCFPADILKTALEFFALQDPTWA